MNFSSHEGELTKEEYLGMIKRVSDKKLSKPKRGGFVYKPPRAEKVKERSEQRGGRFDSPIMQQFESFRPEGDNLIRILPATWDDADYWALEVWVHQFINEQGSYMCLQKMKQKPCPICKEAKRCKDAGEQEEGKALEATKRALVWVIDRDDEADPPIPRWYLMPWTLDRDLSVLAQNKRVGKLLFVDHPDEGYDISFKKDGKGVQTRYIGIAIEREKSPINDDQKVQDEIMDFITENPLPSILEYKDADYLKRIVEGDIEEDDPDKDEDDPDKDEEERQEEEAEEEADEKPHTKRARDEEEEVEEEEQEEERPRARKRA
ncbi:MAG: hypothetical protein MN733_43420, partial [Nitrososphaera sp.]|nr:hypothetical protein [Nitrososphaera sp.]